MTISGFTIIRDAVKYDFPVVESICSVLDLVDEFVIALGNSEDQTEEVIRSIQSDKIKIIRSNWDLSTYNAGGTVYASQTDVALKACTGDWCFYIQADEVLHESAVPVIRSACENHLNQPSVEGFLLRYMHLYADHRHYIDMHHFGYPKEVRIVRNLPDVHSWRDAQSFRMIPAFDYKDYRQKKNTRALKCVLLKDAYIYHYGWSRNPYAMVKKKNAQYVVHYGDKSAMVNRDFHDYGNLSYFPLFKGEHPAIVKPWVEKMNWEQCLRYTGPKPVIPKVFQWKYRIISFIENKFLPNGNRIFGFKNYKQIGIF